MWHVPAIDAAEARHVVRILPFLQDIPHTLTTLMSNPRPTKKSRIVYSERNSPSTPPSTTSSEAVRVSCTNNNARRMRLGRAVVLRQFFRCSQARCSKCELHNLAFNIAHAYFFLQPWPCQEWLPFRKEYLDELHRHDALGRYAKPPTCSQCGEREGVLKCVDCFAGGLHCAVCMKELHTQAVLHRLQV